MAETTVTQTAADVPAVIKPYVQAGLTNLANVTDPTKVPYYGMQGYGQTTGTSPFEAFNPLQMQGAYNAATLGPTQQVAQGSDIAANAAQQAQGAGANYFGMVQNPSTVGAFMSPYMQNVVDTQKQQAVQDYARALPQLGAGAAKVGGLGGTRSALMQSEANRNLQNQLQGIQATGTQNAYQNAMQNMQYGSNLGLQGTGLAGTLASTLGNLGMSDFYQRQQAATTQNQIGGGIQDYANKVNLAKFQDWQAQQNYPYTATKNLLSGIQQIPIQGGTTTQTSPSNTWGNIGATALGLGSLYNAFFG